jgi:septal ring factor EnvC (AmiA/AmiB activator)
MTPETIAIITVGVGLGGLMLTLFQFTIRRIDSLERRMERGFEAVESRFVSVERRIDSSQQQHSSLSERLARLEGLMEAIRDMLMRAPAAP